MLLIPQISEERVKGPKQVRKGLKVLLLPQMSEKRVKGVINFCPK